MILILPLGVLVQVHRNGYFLRRTPPPNPPSPRRLGLVRLAKVSPHPPASRAPPEGPQNMVNFPGDFLALPRKCFGGKIRAKIHANICTNNSCKQSAQKSAQKNCATNLCNKSMQKIRAENPCKKSLQKSVRNSPCKRLPQSNIAN